MKKSGKIFAHVKDTLYLWRTLKRIIDIVIAVQTALITTLSAKAAGIVQ